MKLLHLSMNLLIVSDNEHNDSDVTDAEKDSDSDTTDAKEDYVSESCDCVSLFQCHVTRRIAP